MFDAIVVGARCGGAPTAMLLGRQGHKVLLVDRASFPSDTLSTHFIWPRGTSYLNRWGLFDELRRTTPIHQQMHVHLEDVRLSGRVPLEHLASRFSQLHGDDASYVVQDYCSARRTVLDELLVRAAERAGVEVRCDFEVDELLFENGRVVGIVGRGPDGRPVRERALIVIGADGRSSMVAAAVGAPQLEPNPKCSFAYYSYFSGVALPPRLMRRGRLGVAAVPTNGDASMVLVFGPSDWFASFRADAERNFLRAIRLVDAEAAERIAAGRREEKFRGTNDMGAFWRKGGGPGWALVGDAACFKDQSSAAGITHAFRDAALAAESIGRGLSGETTLDEAVDDYARRRYLDGIDYYRFACMQAEMNPARLDEVELWEAVAAEQAFTDRFISVSGDAFPVRKFMSKSNIAEIFRGRPPFDQQRRRAHEAKLDEQCQNPFLVEPSPAKIAEQIRLSRSSLDYARGLGTDLVARTQAYADWVQERRQAGSWSHTRFIGGVPTPAVSQMDELGRTTQGVNFASQDYLSLCSHPEVREAAVKALTDFGPHSAGSAMGLGNTPLSRRLERAIAEHFQMEHVLLFPTGWAAGFGAIAGLVGPEDHVVLDALTHNCLNVGARFATSKVERHLHLDLDSARYVLARIRARDKRNGILLVTEGLFSMHSDWPRIEALQALCRQYSATLLVDVAHDNGAFGPRGTGQLGVQNLLGKVDLVMGSFSKTFASNGGFLASHSEGVTQFVKHFAGPHIYSNGLSPAQAAVVGKAFEIVRSAEGDTRRQRLHHAIHTLRARLAERGHPADGRPSPIVPVVIGDERVARVAYHTLWKAGVGVTMVEFPIVESGKARFRLQCMTDHTEADCLRAADAVADALDAGYAEIGALVGGAPPAWRPEVPAQTESLGL